ncbi:MAG: hypothetical protein M0C28_25720 [Candidatus Moduliflexus flocculans]|nr:hypothetical protein [Candidatus Moduliflexus flocculans]
MRSPFSPERAPSALLGAALALRLRSVNRFLVGTIPVFLVLALPILRYAAGPWLPAWLSALARWTPTEGAFPVGPRRLCARALGRAGLRDGRGPGLDGGGRGPGPGARGPGLGGSEHGRVRSQPGSRPSGRPGPVMGNLARLAAADLRMLARDPLLAFLPFVPFPAALALRFAVPLLSGFLERALGFRLLDWADLIRAVILLFPGMFYGMAAGFLLLDDRDDGVSAYWGVTPAAVPATSAPGWAFLRLRLPGGHPGRPDIRAGAAGPGPGTRSGGDRCRPGGLLRPLPGGLCGGQGGGLSVLKALGGLDLAPLAVLLALPLRAAAWPFPQYWAAELLLGRNLPPLPALAAGLASSALWIAALYGKYRRRIE